MTIPRPGQQRYAKQVGLTMPPEVWDRFLAEAGEVYGAKSELFRKMLNLWLEVKNTDEGKLLEQIRVERARRIRAERILDTVRAALRSEGIG